MMSERSVPVRNFDARIVRLRGRATPSGGKMRRRRRRMQSVEGEYAPSPWDWVRQQVETYERTGGREANTLRDTGLPVIILTTRGNKSGKVRKTPLMRVEHDGQY